jgi:predicted nucleotidyltransferase
LPHLTPKDRIAVAEYIEHIRARFPDRILAVVLFGSKARGDADDESDIDLLVLVDTEDDEFRSELWHIASDISLEYNVVVSPCVFGQEQWDETRRIRMPLYREIEKYNVPLTPELVPI